MSLADRVRTFRRWRRERKLEGALRADEQARVQHELDAHDRGMVEALHTPVPPVHGPGGGGFG